MAAYAPLLLLGVISTITLEIGLRKNSRVWMAVSLGFQVSG